jgi:uncharacterized delta-60 repeat protein
MDMRRPAIRAATSTLFALLVASALFPAQSGAVAGQLDPGFGNGGFTVLDEPSLKNESLSDVIVLPDGKILGAGGRGSSSGFLLARLNPDGKPDASFGPEGIRVEPDQSMEGNPRRIEAIQLRADGKIDAVGLGRGPKGVGAFEFARYKSNGELDPEFGTNGLTTVPIEPFGDAFGLDQTAGGKLVATGSAGEGKAAVVRVTEDGEPDSTFNAAPKGVRLVDVPESISEEGEAVEVLSGGTVLIGGESDNGAFLAELNANGEPVSGFGTAGIAVHDMGTDVVPTGEIFDLKVLPDGRILAAGSALAAPNDEESFVARFKPEGELDPTFGTGGIFRANPTPLDDETESLEVLPDGRILVAGLRGDNILGQTADTWLYRLTPEGKLDPTFGTGGEAFAGAAPGFDAAFGLALQPDGKAVVAGDAETPGGDELLFGRFLADSPLEPIKGTGSPKTRRCAGRKATIIGSGQADRIRGTKGVDVVVALGGNDRIDTRGGNDVICGGAGNDKVNAGKGRDTVLGERGRDVLVGGPGPDLCNGGAGRRDTAKHSCEKVQKVP